MSGQGAVRRALAILWPAFLVAALADAMVFSLFDPSAILPEHCTLAPLAVYTIGFLFFWVMGALASMLTLYLVSVPEQQPRF